MDTVLTPETDKNGETLAIGDIVRSYDFPGFQLDIYTDGILQAIGEDIIEGCARYRILILRHHRPLSTTGDFDNITYEFTYPYPHLDQPQHIYPPVNGTPTWFDKITDGVVKIDTI